MLFLYKHTGRHPHTHTYIYTQTDIPNEIKAKNNSKKGAWAKDLSRSPGLKSEKLWRLALMSGKDLRQRFGFGFSHKTDTTGPVLWPFTILIIQSICTSIKPVLIK